MFLGFSIDIRSGEGADDDLSVLLRGARPDGVMVRPSDVGSGDRVSLHYRAGAMRGVGRSEVDADRLSGRIFMPEGISNAEI